MSKSKGKPNIPPSSGLDRTSQVGQRVEQMAQQAKQARVAACLKELQAVLARHRCQIVPVVEIRAGQVATRIEIVAVE